MAIQIDEPPYTRSEQSEQWELACAQCFQTISCPSRRPSLNPSGLELPRNLCDCSCNDNNEYPPPHPESTDPYFPPSTTTSTSTASSTDGSDEIMDDDDDDDDDDGNGGGDPMESLHVNVSLTCCSNKYLPLAPAAGLNEVQHRRSASIRSEMGVLMRRFVEDLWEGNGGGGEEDVLDLSMGGGGMGGKARGFISQEVFVMGQSKRGKRTGSLTGTTRSEWSGNGNGKWNWKRGWDDGALGGEGDVMGVGAWDGEGDGDHLGRGGCGCEGDTESEWFWYPLAMSGLSGVGSGPAG